MYRLQNKTDKIRANKKNCAIIIKLKEKKKKMHTMLPTCGSQLTGDVTDVQHLLALFLLLLSVAISSSVIHFIILRDS
jgi:hypothetical protein